VGMQHPTEHVRVKVALDRVALGLGRNRTLRAEHRLSILSFRPARLLALLGKAPVHVLVPAGTTERNTVVEAIEAGILAKRVHRADEMQLAIAAAFVEERGRLGRIEAKRLLQRVTVIGEVKD